MLEYSLLKGLRRYITMPKGYSLKERPDLYPEGIEPYSRQKKYLKTEKGKEANRRAQLKYREKKKMAELELLFSLEVIQ